jgi:hypothetical protein
MNRIKHIAQMIYGFLLYWIVLQGLKTFSDWLFHKCLPDIGYYAMMPRDENKWHELPYGAGGKKPVEKG